MEPPFIHDTSLTVVEINGKNVKILLVGEISRREEFDS
jgi:hypothetical protein